MELARPAARSWPPSYVFQSHQTCFIGRQLANCPNAEVCGRETCREEAATELANCLESLANRIVWSSELVKDPGSGTGMTIL